MTQEDRWDENFQQILGYMLKFKRRPSKHRIEDHLMLNWMKYNKKQMAMGNLSESRRERFCYLLSIAKRYQKVNQNAYIQTADAEQPALI